MPLVFAATAPAQSTNLAVTVRHAPSLNGNGRIEGSLQQLLGENATLNGGFTLTGDLLAPGTPTLRVNGNPTFAGTIVGTGNASPGGYQITLNGNCSLNHLRTRINPVTLPTVAAPPQPVGTRSVTINNSGQSIGDPATLRNLTLNGNVGQVTVPPGTYGTFTVNGGSGVVLGVAGGLQAVNYDFQNLNLNGNSTLKVVGPVVLTAANGFAANGTVGASNNPAWLQLQVASGGFTLNGGCTVYGLVLAPNGTVIINGNSTLVGSSASDQFILNGGGLVRWGGLSTQTNPPPVATPQSITLAENSPTNITLTGSEPQGRTLTFSLLTLPTHGTVSGTPPSVTYKPATNYFGSDAFTFKVNNGITDSSPATVSLTVTQVYYPPTAFSQSLTNFEDTALPVALTGYDPQGYALTFSVLTQPAHGTLSGTAPNLTYKPATNYFGNDSFTFRVNDGAANSLSATISITNRPVDDAPVVVAGPNQLLILPANSVNLAGSVTYDVFPGTVDTVVWSTVSGPGVVIFSNPSNPQTMATFSQSGVYQLRLFASDSFLSGSSDLSVTVDAPPVVNAGPALTNTFPGTVTVSGSATDDGLPANGTLTVVWSKISGPGTVLFGDAGTTNTTVTCSTNGVYRLRLTADDGIATNQSDVTVIENLPPAVNAGVNILTNGLNATLNGIVTDDGLPMAFLSVRWSQSAGPGTITFGNAAATNTTVAASQSGTYVLVLTANDGAATNSNEVAVTFNLPPVVNAGPDQTVNLGTTVTLAGTVADDQLPHNILTSAWTEASGPGNTTFTDASLTNTTATFDQPGTYILRLTASDTMAATNADVVIRINAAPLVNAGTDQMVNLGTSVTLAGSYTDDGIPGSPVTTFWTQVSGPANVVFADPATASTTVNFSQSGVYEFQLTVDDGLTNSSARVTVIVNQAPIVSVTADKLTVEMPGTINLSGIVYDDGLPKGTMTCMWNQDSGSGLATFSNRTGTNTTASFNSPGTYILSLTASDSLAEGSNKITLTVLPTNQPPVANSQTLSVPNDTVLKITLAGSDPEGASLTYTLLSEPVHGTLNPQPLIPNQYNYTPATGYEGLDSFTFKVNDGRLDSAPATVIIDVEAATTSLQLNVPGSQTIPHNMPLVFGASRPISITDEDAGLGVVELSHIASATARLPPCSGRSTTTPTEPHSGRLPI
ncbi:MAG: Ig-like domain-containing protein [Verrucomicrobiota bacterium]